MVVAGADEEVQEAVAEVEEVGQLLSPAPLRVGLTLTLQSQRTNNLVVAKGLRPSTSIHDQ